MMSNFYPVAKPILNGNEKKYVADCIDSTWISSAGSYIEKFEEKFAEFCGVKYAISVMNGTVALHLALLAIGVKPGDEVIVPTFTYVATANSVKYVGAKPVFVDCDPLTWNIDTEKIKQAITPKTKGIIVVHIYGQPCEMDEIRHIAEENKLFLIEDAAEAHGALYHGRKVGSLSDIATFSFFGNKIITTGEGGMVLTNNEILAAKMRQLKGQGMDPKRRYWFPIIGYNYRMTNVQAALGLAQLENIEWHLSQRERVYLTYRKYLSSREDIIFQGELNDTKSSYWMISVIIDKPGLNRDLLMKKMLEHGIETRPFFYPMHILPPYKRTSRNQTFPVADSIYGRGINLPSYGTLTEEDIQYIANTLCKILDEL